MGEREKVLSYLAAHSVKKGRFRLASGRESDTYVDVKQTAFTAEGLRLLGRWLFAQVRRAGVRTVGGVAVGAIPLVSAVLFEAATRRYALAGFFIRPGPKDHGLQREIEGCLSPGSPTAILEDVVTTGRSCLEAIEKAKAAGADVVQVIAVVDREEGGREFLWERGYRLTALATLGELARRVEGAGATRTGE